MRKLFQCIIILLSLGSCERNSTKIQGQEIPQKPNVVFILADDFGLNDLGFMGSDFYETPNIDRLAAKSMVFTQGYSTSRVCSPSRASIMTGKFTARTGITDWIGAAYGADWRKNKRHDKLLPAGYVHHLPQKDVTIAEAMRTNGYKTFFAGKWHLGSEGSYPEDHGFEVNKGGWESGGPKGGYFSPFANPKLQDKVDGENLSIRLASETVDFISQNKDSSFFAFLSFYAVHGPIQTTEEKWRKYRNKAVATGISPNGFVMEKKLPIRVTQDNPIYAGLVETMDEAIGIVLDGLEEMGLEENTVIVFTSDNGGVASGDAFSTSNLPFRGGKGYQWEGGIRAPFMIFVPGQNLKGRKNDYPVTGADFYPTLLDLADIDLLPGQHMDGVSLKPLLTGNAELPERPLYWHYPHYGNQGGDPSSVVRMGKWKLIHYYEDNTDELYNLEEDPFEKTDLAAENLELTLRLNKELMEWLDSVEALYPSPDENFDENLRADYDYGIRTKRLAELEEQRLEFLSDSFNPKNSWWGSKGIKD